MSDSGFKNFKISDRKTYIVLDICMICQIKNQLISIFSEETTVTIKETKKPVGKHFKISGRDSSVFNNNCYRIDAERKIKEKFWMHRLKSFWPNGMNKQIDFIKINASWPYHMLPLSKFTNVVNSACSKFYFP